MSHPMKFVFLLAGSIATAGCVQTTPRLDSQFGASVGLMQAQQTIDPGAAAKHPAPDGVEGITAKDTIDHYRTTFRKPPPQPNILTIGIGSRAR